MSDAATPALGFSIVADLARGRQMTVQYFVGRDDPVKAMHAMADRVMAVMDRQKAKYELGELRDELLTLEGKVIQFKLDREKIDRDYAVKLAQLDVQIQTAGEAAAEIQEQAYQAHVENGRQGIFKLTGHAKANAERVAAGRQQIADDIAKQQAERLQALHGVETSITTHEKAHAGFVKQIAEREALLSVD